MSETLTLAEIDELERLHKAAMPGEWRSDAYGCGGVHVYDAERHAKKRAGEGPAMWHEQVFDGWASGGADCRATAALHNAAPKLFDAARRTLAAEAKLAE